VKILIQKSWCGSSESPYYELEESQIEFVGGNEGVFATYRQKDCVMFLAGDDGAWRELGSYHKDWIPLIIQNLSLYKP
jgi:hypothetical protein